MEYIVEPSGRIWKVREQTDLGDVRTVADCPTKQDADMIAGCLNQALLES